MPGLTECGTASSLAGQHNRSRECSEIGVDCPHYQIRRQRGDMTREIADVARILSGREICNSGINSSAQLLAGEGPARQSLSLCPDPTLSTSCKSVIELTDHRGNAVLAGDVKPAIHLF